MHWIYSRKDWEGKNRYNHFWQRDTQSFIHLCGRCTQGMFDAGKKKTTTYFHQPSVSLETVAGWIKVYLPVSTLSPLLSIAQQPGLHIVIAQQIIVKSMMLIHELVYWEIIAPPIWLFGWNISIKPGFSLRSDVFTQSAASFYFSLCSYKWKNIIHFKD